jgi:HD-like signal output (HDOD) protein
VSRRSGRHPTYDCQKEATLLDHTVLVTAAYDLAPLPAAVVRLAALLGKETYSVADVEAIVRLDAPLTGRLLQYANSAASASRVPIGTVREAVLRVGIGPLLSFATATTIRPNLMHAIPAYGLPEGDLWRHSVAAALASEVIAQTVQVEVPPDSFTASLLHDIGKLTLSRFLDPDHLRWLAAAREQGGESSLRAEIEVLGVHHGELGGLIASHWSLPVRVVGGITHHHEPTAGGDVICDVVHVANVLAKRAGTGHVATPSDLDAEPDALKRLGIAAGRLAALEDTVRDRLAQAVEQFG